MCIMTINLQSLLFTHLLPSVAVRQWPQVSYQKAFGSILYLIVQKQLTAYRAVNKRHSIMPRFGDFK